jgi:beta-lactam-binding protein with PASTA domain
VVVTYRTGREQVQVPRILGQDLGTAQRNLEDAGLRLGNVGHQTSDQPPETVISTSPEIGQEVDKGTAVDVVLAQAPTPSPTPSPTPEPTPPPTPVPTPVPTPEPTPTPAPPTATPAPTAVPGG